MSTKRTRVAVALSSILLVGAGIGSYSLVASAVTPSANEPSSRVLVVPVTPDRDVVGESEPTAFPDPPSAPASPAEPAAPPAAEPAPAVESPAEPEPEPGAPSGTAVPFHASDDPNNAAGGDYEDPGVFCASHSASTVNGVPTCD